MTTNQRTTRSTPAVSTAPAARRFKTLLVGSLALLAVGLLPGCESSSGSGVEDSDSDPVAATSASDSAEDSADSADNDDAGAQGEYPELVTACALRNAEPTALAFSATDSATGAAGMIDVATRTVKTDLALAQTDTAFSAGGGNLFLINRFMFDYIDALDPTNDLAVLGEFSVAIEDDRSSNPHALHLAESGEAYVTLYGDDALQVWDLSDPGAPASLREVDFSDFADADGLPEMGTIIPCGDVAFVGIERLDRDNSWTPTDTTQLVPVRTGSDQFFDWDGEDGPDSVDLLGVGIKMARLDPADASGHAVFVLSSGLERVNLATGTSEWVISAERFEAAGLGNYQLRSFDLHGTDVIFTGAAADFSSHSLYRASLEGAGADLEAVFDGLQTTTGAIEVVGNEAWFPDTTAGASGVRIFDLTAEPVAEIGSPLSTGLPPYTLFPLP